MTHQPAKPNNNSRPTFLVVWAVAATVMGVVSSVLAVFLLLQRDPQLSFAQSEAERGELLRLRSQITALRQSEKQMGQEEAGQGAATSVRLSGISFIGNTVFSDAQLANVLVSKVGEPLNQQRLFQDAFAIHELYRQGGHGQVSVQPVRGANTLPGQSAVTFVVGETNLEAGIGVQVAYVKPMGALYIEKVMPNSPAETAGLPSGLFIKEIDGKSTRELTYSQCVMLLRGGVGTKVRLGLWDSNQKTNLTLEITRQKLVL